MDPFTLLGAFVGTVVALCSVSSNKSKDDDDEEELEEEDNYGSGQWSSIPGCRAHKKVKGSRANGGDFDSDHG